MLLLSYHSPAFFDIWTCQSIKLDSLHLIAAVSTSDNMASISLVPIPIVLVTDTKGNAFDSYSLSLESLTD